MTSHIFSWINQDPVACNAIIRPNQVACVDLSSGKECTYRQLNDEVGRCVAFLRGIIPDTTRVRIAFMGHNSIRAVELFYACGRIGAIYVPLNHRLSGAELRTLVEDARPIVTIYDSSFHAQAKEAAGPQGSKLLAMNPLFDYVTLVTSRSEPDRSVAINADAPWCLLYTSGTTGRPKGAIVTPRTAFYSAINFSHLNCVTAESVMLCNIPLFHVAGLLAVLHTSLLAGATVLLREHFFPKEVLTQLSDSTLGVTHYFVSPHMAKLIHREPSFEERNLSRLRAICSGGGPLAPSLVQDFLARGVPLIDGYGSSEAGTVMGMPLDRELVKAKAGSCGIPGPAVEVRLVDAHGHDVAEGEIGEIWLRGPAVTPGYWNQAKTTAEAFCGGWFLTGDAARRDADGFYYIVGRCKDMYIAGGEKVYPAEVENVLNEIDGVAEAAVIGVPDSRLGECGVAYVAVKPGASLREDDIVGRCAERLARYKRPRHVRFVEAIPRTASGKIEKDTLRLSWAHEHAEGPLAFAYPS